MKLPPLAGGGNFGELPGEDFTDDNTADHTNFPLSAERLSQSGELLAHLRIGRRAAAKHERAQGRTEALIDRDLDAWVAAAEHLHHFGLPPLVPLHVSRALWKRGNRSLAAELARLQGVGS